MTAIPQTSREVTLIANTEGDLKADYFKLVERSVPEPGPNQILVRNRWFRISISTRLMANKEAQHIKGIPFPPLKPGDTLADGAIGEVVKVGPGVSLRVGSRVMHPLGWREYALVSATQCTTVDDDDVEPAAWLGHGWTAYAALTRAVGVRDGDTVFVTSGAGAIGSMAAQIARLLGAGRVIGSTGSTEKVDWMRTELGYDAVITRDGGDVREQLAKAAPDGIDVIVDMMGGEQLAAAIEQTREGARGVLLGALTAELNPHNATLKAPVEIDTFQLILKGVTLRGFSADEHASEVFPAWLRQVGDWLRRGAIRLPQTRVAGIERATLALEAACAGRLKGVVLVEV
ncbi:MDR family NADP-dependent oxidoreductase [Pararobbsia silviterrae]|uniref:NADP-dependent oxidoreductase n=1 Tax=Pararobbsia silviterrae TaxID=1792498 RepID=A0A494XYV1_9BURK|nr:NADP-dependent oxidoreductase [Pararobbsia silviterrae]RKP53304.1 NADP-dependent oxidoreductase [Pararobbsia silviterrae]